MGNTEIEKSKALNLVKVLEYFPKAVFGKTIVRKLTGNIMVSSLDTGECISEKVSPFDAFIQIIDGRAEIIIDGESKILETSDGIMAHQSSSLKANERFKMISTVIKSGYE